MQAWENLTRLGRIRRLRTLALAALEHYDLAVRKLSLLVYGYNCTFRIDTTDGRIYVLRINRPFNRSAEEIAIEMDWLAALSTETDLRVPQPLPTREGRLNVQVHVEGVPEARWCAVFTWLPGPLLAAKLSPYYLHQLGHITARLHQHVQSFRHRTAAALRVWDQPFPFGHEQALFAPNASGVTAEQRAVFEQTLQRVEAALAWRRQHGEEPFLLHADLHQFNIKVQAEQLAVLDFDDCMRGYAIQDAAITMYYLRSQPNYATLLESFQAGYGQRLPWPEGYQGELETFVAGRALILANYILLDFGERAPTFIERTAQQLTEFLTTTPAPPA